MTAYSMADNELWLRHGFNMVYQVSVAVYVMYSSPLEGHALAPAILLLFAGATKYGERTVCLWFGSSSQFVRSCLPISKYMKDKNVVKHRGYVVMGEEKLQRMIEKGFGAASTERRDIEAGQEAPRGVVTIQDLENAGIKDRDYNLCLSHALFKMYKRRFVSLYFDEGDWMETRALWVQLCGKKAFKIAEMELKFMYDALFWKWNGTAFSKWGVPLRLLNISLMGVVGFLILREREYRQAQRTVTYVVIPVALVVEVCQLCRIMISDWTRVRLICAFVEELKYPLCASKWCSICRLKVIEIALFLLGKVRDVFAGDSYWSNGIHQHCLIGTCLNRSRFVWKMAKFFPKTHSFIVSWYTHKVPIQEELKDFIFSSLKQKFPREDDNEKCRERIYNFDEELLEEESLIKDVFLLHDNLEEVILTWHIATTICYRKRESRIGNETEHVRYSRILSRYCAYLLLSRPRLLPVHPDMARIAYMQLVEQLGEHSNLAADLERSKDPRDLFNCGDKCALGFGAELAHKLLEKEEGKRWELLAEYWAGLVIYMALYNKSQFHAECVTEGGEFLSQVWVLLGHMGCGEQSDSVVKLKIEMSPERRARMERERRERRERIERERMERMERIERERIEGERMERERERMERMEREHMERERKDEKGENEKARFCCLKV